MASELGKLDEILGFDAILIVGADPRSEAPLLNLRIREAALAGTNVVLVDNAYLGKLIIHWQLKRLLLPLSYLVF